MNSQVSNLRDLDISDNNISELEAAAQVAKIIAQTQLKSLRLNRNPLGDAGAGDPNVEFDLLFLGES